MQALLHSVPPTLQQATTDPPLCQRLLDTHGQVWVSLLWGHCSFLLGPGAHKVLFVSSKSLFPQSYVSSGSSIVGLMATTSKRVYAISTPRAPVSVADHCQPVCTSTGGTQFCLSFCGVPGSWCAQYLFEPSGSLWLNGFDSKHQFAPPTILLEFLLCLCTWGISSLSFQHCAARELYSMLN